MLINEIFKPEEPTPVNLSQEQGEIQKGDYRGQ